MHVLKRALNLALALTLALPVNAWARSERSHSRETVHSKKGFVAVDKTRVNRKAVRTAKRNRVPSSFTAVSAPRKQVTSQEVSQSMSPGKALSSVMPKPGGKNGQYDVIEIKGKNGRLKARVLSRGDYREVISDEDGDGTADIIEVTRGNFTTKVHSPYRGKFTRVDYSEKRAGAFVKSSLLLDSRTDKYVLVNASVEKFKSFAELKSPLNEKGIVVGEVCSAQKDQLSDFEKILEEIRTAVGGEKTAAITCKVERYQDAFFDKSCDANSEMKKSKPDMIKGLAKILGSRGSKDPGQYLQCLEDKGYGYHSAKIQEALAAELQTAKSSVAAESRWTDRDFLDNQCPRLDEVRAYDEKGALTKSTKKFTKILKEHKPLFRCELRDSPLGYWSPDDNRIALNATSAKMQNEFKIPADDAYASLMFHEMLHHSGVGSGDERFIENAQVCCGPSSKDASGKKAACGVLETRVSDIQFMVRVSQMPGFVDLKLNLQRQLGDRTDDFLDTWANEFRTSPNGKAALANYEKCKLSKQGEEVARCTAGLMAVARSYSSGFVDKRCGGFQDYSETRYASCPLVKEAFANAFADQRLITPRIPPVEIITASDLVIAPVSLASLESPTLLPLGSNIASAIGAPLAGSSGAGTSTGASGATNGRIDATNDKNPATKGPLSPADVARDDAFRNMGASANSDNASRGDAPTAINFDEPATGSTAARDRAAADAALNKGKNPSGVAAAPSVAAPSAEAPASTNVAARPSAGSSGATGSTSGGAKAVFTDDVIPAAQPTAAQPPVARPPVASQPSSSQPSYEPRDDRSEPSMPTRGSSGSQSGIPSSRPSTGGEFASGVPMDRFNANSGPMDSLGGADLSNPRAGIGFDSVVKTGSAITQAIVDTVLPKASAAGVAALRLPASTGGTANTASYSAPNYSAPSAAANSYAAASGSGGARASSKPSGSSSSSAGSSRGSRPSSGSGDEEKSATGSSASKKQKPDGKALASASGEASDDVATQAQGANEAAQGGDGAGSRSAASLGAGVSVNRAAWRQAVSAPTKFVSYVVAQPATQLRQLTKDPAFVESMRSGGWGIQESGGHVTGFSNPAKNKLFVYCGDKVVLYGFCPKQR